jgi:CRP-like cAMP-binding protein
MQVPCFECELRACGLFKPITPNELGAINEIKREHLLLPAGTEIIRAGDDSPEIYTLYSGWAFRFKTLPDGRRQILNFLLPGDLLGLQAAMFDAAQHGIEALTDVQLCLLPRRKVWALFGEMPGLAFDVAWLGSREEGHVDENLTSVGRRTAAERVAALIVSLYKRAKVLGLVVDETFSFPLTQQHIADALGLSLVHTNKTLARLRRMGMYTRANGSLTLGNPRVIERVAQYFDDVLDQQHDAFDLKAAVGFSSKQNLKGWSYVNRDDSTDHISSDTSGRARWHRRRAILRYRLLRWWRAGSRCHHLVDPGADGPDLSSPA